MPEADELAEIFNRSSLRTGAIVSLISKAGLRLRVAGNEDATDGLMMKDLPDIGIVQGRAVCLKKPAHGDDQEDPVKGRSPILYLPHNTGNKETDCIP
ncbi:hypothetical protein DYY67_1253 [Candidatus Nitrosotalea sp. TS]|nr:hypothetical protein [Candidatus Nitrosotalea sp. TS]